MSVCFSFLWIWYLDFMPPSAGRTRIYIYLPFWIWFGSVWFRVGSVWFRVNRVPSCFLLLIFCFSARFVSVLLSVSVSVSFAFVCFCLVPFGFPLVSFGSVLLFLYPVFPFPFLCCFPLFPFCLPLVLPVFRRVSSVFSFLVGSVSSGGLFFWVSCSLSGTSVC